MAGIFHAYYTVALAPAIAALVGIGATGAVAAPGVLRRGLLLASTVALTTAFAFMLLPRTPDYLPWLRWVVAVARSRLRAAARRAPAPASARRCRGRRRPPCVAALAAPTAYSVTTAGTPHTGSIPSGRAGRLGTSRHRRPRPAAPTPAADRRPARRAPAWSGGDPAARTGGLLEGSTSSARDHRAAQADADSYTWAAAAVGSNSAAGYQLASEQPVMAIGGFNGSDPSPTLAQFQQYVADGEIHYFIAGGEAGGGRRWARRGGQHQHGDHLLGERELHRQAPSTASRSTTSPAASE